MTDPIEAVATALHESMVQQDVNGYLDAKIDASVLARAAIETYRKLVASEAVAWTGPRQLEKISQDWQTDDAQIWSQKNAEWNVSVKNEDTVVPLFAAPPAPQPRVKPLVWEESRIHGDDAIAWLADAVVHPNGAYIVNKVYFCGREEFQIHLAESYEKPSFDTIEAAKAAAQADYETRVLSALESAPAIPAGWKLVPVEPTQAMLDEVTTPDKTWPFDNKTMRDVFIAMIAAAPAPEAVE